MISVLRHLLPLSNRPKPLPDGHEPTLKARRVQLRALDHPDTDAIYRLFSDPDLTQYACRETFTSRADVAVHLEASRVGFERGELLQWGITLVDQDDVIGMLTLSRIDPVQRRATISFALPTSCQDYAHEAVVLLIEHALSTLGLRRLEANVNPANRSVIRVLDTLGFRHEGFLRQHWLISGEPRDCLILGLLESDWFDVLRQ